MRRFNLAWPLAAACLIAVGTAPMAHEAPSGWAYDYDCCSQKDCHEIPVDETPRVTPQGFVLHDGSFVAKNSSHRRDSKDVRWHRCDGHYTAGAVSVPFVRCLYVPSGGF